MRMMKKGLALSLVAAMALAATACGNSAAESSTSAQTEVQETEVSETVQTENEEETAVSAVEDFTVTPLTISDHEVLVCYPTPNAGQTLGVSITCTAPVFMVFGDTYDEESAKAYALESGLADIAAQEGSSILFVNPAGDTWGEADSEIYAGIIDMIDDSSTSDIADGISTSVNYFTNETEQKITGTTGRVYVYGVGAGADFVAENFVKPVMASVTYGDGVTMEFDRTATAVTLDGATDASGIEANDMTVVAIGCSDEVNAALEENCGSVITEDTADFVSEYAAVGAYRRQAGILVPVYDWEAEGITEKIETYTVNTSSDNVTFAGTETHDINFVTYYADDLDVTSGNVPLVLCFHGGGNTAMYEAQATQWPLIGKEHGFITVSVDLHYPNVTAAETIDLINYLETEYSIDASRIYASGFSMGSCKSWDLFEQYPTVFAGLAPMDATSEPGEDSFGNAASTVNSDTLVPVFWVGGETSPLAEMPNQDAKCVDRAKYVFDVNQVVKEYNCSFDDQSSWENAFWGVNGDITYQVTAADFTDSTLTVELYASEDGKYYTAFAVSGNQSHEVYARNSWAAYDFLSQFSRNEDGSISIEAVTYSMPSDDGSVTDNAYNQ